MTCTGIGEQGTNSVTILDVFLTDKVTCTEIGVQGTYSVNTLRFSLEPICGLL